MTSHLPYSIEKIETPAGTSEVIRSFWGSDETEHRLHALSFRYSLGTRANFIRVLLAEAVELLEKGEKIELTIKPRPKNPGRPNDFFMSQSAPAGETEGTLRSLHLPGNLDEKLRVIAHQTYNTSIYLLVDHLVPYILERRKQAGERTYAEEPRVPITTKSKIVTTPANQL